MTEIREGESLQDRIERFAVDALYEARESGKVMDEAAREVARVVQRQILLEVATVRGHLEGYADIAEVGEIDQGKLVRALREDAAALSRAAREAGQRA